MAPLKPLVATFFLLGLVACGEATGSSSADITTTSSSSPLAIGGGDTATATAAPTAPPTPTPTATPAPTPAPTPRPTAAPTKAPTAAPVANTCGAPPNPWGYTFCSGSTISSPPSNFCDVFTPCINSFWNGRGYVEQCQDGSYSKSGGISGSCSYHGGNRRPLYQP